MGNKGQDNPPTPSVLRNMQMSVCGIRTGRTGSYLVVIIISTFFRLEAPMPHSTPTSCRWKYKNLGSSFKAQPGNIFGAHLFPFSAGHPPLRPLSANEVLDDAVAIPLADLLSSQVLETRSERAIDVMILASEAILTRIRQRVKLVAPVALEVKPFDRRVRRDGRRPKRVVLVIVRVAMNIERRIPQWAAISDIM